MGRYVLSVMKCSAFTLADANAGRLFAAVLF
jgi:hypothetical protein